MCSYLKSVEAGLDSNLSLSFLPKCLGNTIVMNPNVAHFSIPLVGATMLVVSADLDAIMFEVALHMNPFAAAVSIVLSVTPTSQCKHKEWGYKTYFFRSLIRKSLVHLGIHFSLK